jgi:hypothetical protein
MPLLLDKGVSIEVVLMREVSQTETYPIEIALDAQKTVGVIGTAIDEQHGTNT